MTLDQFALDHPDAMAWLSVAMMFGGLALYVLAHCGLMWLVGIR